MLQTSYTLRERKDTGKWQGIIRQKQNGKWKQVESKTFIKHREAKQWAINQSAEWQKKVETDYDKMTIGDLKEIYLETKKKEVKESTYLTTCSNIRNANWFDDKTVYELTKHQIKNKCREANYSHIKYMAMFYNFLINELDMKITNSFYKKQPEKKSETFVISYSDFQFILSRCKDESTKLAFLILYYTGMRASELSGLTWDSLSNNEIIINKQIYPKVKGFTDTKSKNSNRIIPLNKTLKSEINKYRVNEKVFNIDNRIFKQKHMGSKLNKALNNICKDTHLEGVTCHDFRHTFTTNLVQNNVDIITVANLAGDDVGTVIKNYVHKTEKTKQLSKIAVESI